MNDDDIENYEFNRKMLENIWPQMKEKLENYNAYEDSWHILETDYDNYALMWKCLPRNEFFNIKGESEQEISYMQMAEPDGEYDTDFSVAKNKYQCFASIYVRNLDDITDE